MGSEAHSLTIEIPEDKAHCLECEKRPDCFYVNPNVRFWGMVGEFALKVGSRSEAHAKALEFSAGQLNKWSDDIDREYAGLSRDCPHKAKGA